MKIYFKHLPGNGNTKVKDIVSSEPQKLQLNLHSFPILTFPHQKKKTPQNVLPGSQGHSPASLLRPHVSTALSICCVAAAQ